MGSSWIAFVFPTFILMCSAEILTYRTSLLTEEHGRVMMDTVLDTLEKTGLFTLGEIPNSSCPSTVNLHDYRTNMVAFKQVSTGLCYIRHSNESLPDVMTMIQHDKMGDNRILPSEHWKISKDVLPYATVEIIAGHKIAEFCKDYEVHQLTRLTSVQDKEKRSPCDFLCFGSCNIIIN